MRLVGRGVLEEFLKGHDGLRSAADSWAAEIRAASWKTPAEMKMRYPQASIVGNNRYVFNLKGNQYRLLAVINFQSQIVLISKVGTHREYDEWKL